MFHGIKLTAFVVARAFVGLVLGLSVWAILPLAIQWQPTVVMSGSMENSIMTGDILVADPVTQEEIASGLLQKGHVILASDPADPNTLFTHRIIRLMDDGSFMTKGDANAQVDRMTVQPEQIKGIERLRIPYIGIPVREMKAGNYAPAIIFGFFFTISLLLIQADRGRYKRVTDALADNDDSAPTRKVSSKAITAILLLSLATGAISTPALHAKASEAFFSGSTMNPASTFRASSTFPTLGGTGAGTVTQPVVSGNKMYSTAYATTVDFTQSFNLSNIRNAGTAGFVPVITWEPKSSVAGANQNDFRPNKILNGSLDSYLNTITSQLITAGNPKIAIRLAPGGNGTDNNWSEKIATNANGSYKAAWRYVVDFFRTQGVKNVDWVWSMNAPASSADASALYPGTGYVTYAGLSFPAFTTAGMPVGTSPEAIARESLTVLSTVAPDKKIVLYQSGTIVTNPTTSQRAWLDDLNRYFQTWSQTRGEKIQGYVGFTY